MRKTPAQLASLALMERLVAETKARDNSLSYSIFNDNEISKVTQAAINFLNDAISAEEDKKYVKWKLKDFYLYLSSIDSTMRPLQHDLIVGAITSAFFIGLQSGGSKFVRSKAQEDGSLGGQSSGATRSEKAAFRKDHVAILATEILQKNSTLNREELAVRITRNWKLEGMACPEMSTLKTYVRKLFQEGALSGDR